MSTKQHYDEDFKRTLVELFTTMVKLRLSYQKSTAYLKLLFPDGSNSIQLLKLMTVKFLLQSR